jgi:hypothetical protein
MLDDKKKAEILEMYPDEPILLADGFEGAFIGIAQVFHTNIAIYDRDKCLWILVDRDGMKFNEAEEFFDFNVVGSYMGENTPGFITLI